MARCSPIGSYVYRSLLPQQQTLSISFRGTSPDIESIKFWGAAYGAVLRPCVPLFVMITGALLLPVRGEASVFYKKRIPRVFFPFIIWSLIYNFFPWITGLLGLNPEVILDFFPYSGEDVMRQSFAVSMGYIAQIPLNFSLLAVHMWYIYLLIGLYLYLPIFSAWVEKASERAKLWFLAAWGVTLLLPYYNEYVSEYLWGGCSWNAVSECCTTLPVSRLPVAGALFAVTMIGAETTGLSVYRCL